MASSSGIFVKVEYDEPMNWTTSQAEKSQKEAYQVYNQVGG